MFPSPLVMADAATSGYFPSPPVANIVGGTASTMFNRHPAREKMIWRHRMLTDSKFVPSRTDKGGYSGQSSRENSQRLALNEWDGWRECWSETNGEPKTGAGMHEYRVRSILIPASHPAG